MQPTKLCWNESCEVAVGEVEDREKREITEVRCNRSNERCVLKRQRRDALPSAATSDTDPEAERRAGGPVGSKDAKRVSELSFESYKCGEVGVTAIAVGRTRKRSRDGRDK
ncbi:hypothetical protein D1007_42071 [Hordeum vulgare]|nr:hypothetical protein D1007_42071 [Hordeum vulgare]